MKTIQDYEKEFSNKYPMREHIDSNKITKKRDTYAGGYKNGHITGVGLGLAEGFKASKKLYRTAIKEIVEAVIGDDLSNTNSIAEQRQRAKGIGRI